MSIIIFFSNALNLFIVRFMLETHAFSYASENYKFVKRAFIRGMELVTGQRKIYNLYKDYTREEAHTDHFFFDSAVNRLDLNVNYDGAALQRIHNTGALVIVANHPYGV